MVADKGVRSRSPRQARWLSRVVFGVVVAVLVAAWFYLPPLIFKSAARALWSAQTELATTTPATDLRQGMSLAEATQALGEPSYSQRSALDETPSGATKAVAGLFVWVGPVGHETRALFIDDKLLDARTGTWPATGN